MLLPRSLEAPSVAPAHADAADSVETRPDPDRRGHLLLVEDDHEVAALTRELLTSLGFSVIHVSSGEAALGALANSRDIDAVLSDVMMPGGVSGLELAREIRRRHPALTILLTTGYVESVADMNDGEFSLLLKPYTVESLARALGIVARRQESTWRASSTVRNPAQTLLSFPGSATLSARVCTAVTPVYKET